MTSSGILKKGLAATAISALAVTGIPALAGSASAAAGDVITVQSVGTARNAGDQGAPIVLNTKGVDPANLDLAGTDLGKDTETNGTQSVTIVGTPTMINSGDTGDLTPGNGLDQISLRVQVTTPPGGDDTADFVIFEDEPVKDGIPNLTEARVQTSVRTTGEVASVDIAPATQSSPSGTPSAPYTVTIRDADGDLTQLTGAEKIDLTSSGDATFGGQAGDDGTDADALADIDASEINDGTADFTATGTLLTSQTITAKINGTQDTAVLTTTRAASIQLDDIDVVTGADSSNGESANNPTSVRVDQTSVRLDISSNDTGVDSDANGTVTFTVTGTGVTFGGKATTTLTTTLDQNGNGSVTITPDAGTIQAGDSFQVDGSGISALVFNFERSTVSATSVDAPKTVFTKVDTPTTVTATVTDQFGQPVAGAQVSADIAGNGVTDSEPRQTTNASGQVTFTFPAGDTQVGDQDTVTYHVFQDAATPNPGITATATTTVKYTADGQGPDYQLTLDGLNTEITTYSPNDVTVVPLTDAVADDTDSYVGGANDETVALTITNGENGVPVDVTVDNGALILTGTATSLEDGKSSATGKVGGTFQIVGTTAGVVTVTTTSGGRTETAQFTVLAQDDTNTARNVTVSGPATVPADTDQIVFTAVVTDAFGNPVQGVGAFNLNVQVTGPGELQDTDAVTNADGQINLNVNVDQGAQGDITITVQGFPGQAQFGADADRLTSGSKTDDAAGLSASMDVAKATTTVEAKVTPPVTPPRTKIVGQLDGRNTGADVDKLKVSTTPRNVADGARVNLFRFNKKGVRVLVESSQLNAHGVKRFQVRDLNGKKATKYVARIKHTDDSKADKRTNSKRIR